MNSNVRSFLKKITYSISANLISTLISVILSFIIPKFLGVEHYSYYQLYVFYVSYTGFFQLGWADGLQLRYGGKEYQELEASLLHSQYWLQVVFDLLVVGGFALYGLFVSTDSNLSFIVMLTGLNCLLLHPRAILQYLLHSTGRVEFYARNLIMERSLSFVFIVLMLFFGYREFEYMLLADVASKAIALLMLSYTCRDIVVTRGVALLIGFKEAWANISAGSKLMFANIASMLVVGVVRFAIKEAWDLETFGKVSFSLNIANLILTFVSAVGIVVFPLIKRSKSQVFSSVYVLAGQLLSAGMYVFLILYYPIKLLICAFLPDYEEAIGYLALLFPLCIFAARNSLLITTYLKALREEKAMLYLNLVALVFSTLVVGCTVLLLHSLVLTILSIVVLLAFKCIIADVYVQKKLGVHDVMLFVFDLLIASLFIVGNWYVGGVVGWLLYCFVLGVYFLIYKKKYTNLVVRFLRIVNE